MSNRGRQNVASYLILDCGIDWRKGADYFESLLVDHDVASNWGNWVSAAGLTGGRVNHFNIQKQSKVLSSVAYGRQEICKSITCYAATGWRRKAIGSWIL